MPAVALTDHGVMYGAIEFYKEAKKEGIKPLIGMEAYVVNRNHTEKAGKGENNHLLLLASNHQGYQNLMKLSTIAHLEGFYYRPRFDKDTLTKYSQGLICTSACPKGEVAQLLSEN
ncbi:MAG: polymerase III, alpha subunit protein, partial [Candidatus Azambacteria bacterium GW2011_GWA1_42_19]